MIECDAGILEIYTPGYPVVRGKTGQRRERDAIHIHDDPYQGGNRIHSSILGRKTGG